MDKLKLWGRLSSCNVQKAVWLLEELQLPYEHIPAGGDFGGLEDPEYRAMNPHGKVPTLKDGDTVVWESEAILRYLAARYGAPQFWSDDPAARAAVDQWLAWTAASLYRDWIDLFWHCVRTPPQRQDAAQIARLRDSTAARYAFLDAELATRPYIAGNTFSIADIAAGLTLYRWYEMPIERPDLPALRAWYDRLLQRPAYRRGASVPFDDLAGKLAY
jgi:glutathione S-transferase